MTENNTVRIAFTGTKGYRAKLQRAALDKGIKVQELLERSLDLYLKLVERGLLDSVESNVRIAQEVKPKPLAKHQAQEALAREAATKKRREA